MFKWNFILFFALLLSPVVSAQESGLILGRSFPLPDPGEKISMHFRDSLSGDSLDRYAFVLVFSSAHSNLSTHDIELLQQFVDNGGGLYIGADNWPFSAESNQLTFAFFGKSSWGNQNEEKAEVNSEVCSNQVLANRKKIPSGQTTVSFPMDYRLKVEAWTGDEPLILSGEIGKGKIILDGGYSRFNTALFQSDETGEIFRDIILFLLK